MRHITSVNITICRIDKGRLGSFVEYPKGVRGSHMVFNPKTRENCLLTAIASFKRLKENPLIHTRIYINQ